MTRAKTLKKTLSFYKNNFDFTEPYNVVVDGSFCENALKAKLQIKEQISSYLGKNTTVHVTTCVIQEIEQRGTKFYGPLVVAKGLKVYPCDHKKSVSSGECLMSLVANQNPNHIFLGTVDEDLTGRIRKQPGLPLLYIVKNTIVLETPSISSREVGLSKRVSTISKEEYDRIDLVKRERGIIQPIQKKILKKKAKGPNPLSCPKKKKKRPREDEPSLQQPTTNGEEQPAKRRRKRNRNKASKQNIQTTQEQN